MQRYIGVKLVEARPMTLDEFEEEFKRPATDKYEDDADGYLVKYPDGYQSWCPEAVFKAANRRIDALTFGHAIEAARNGFKIARKGWNGKGMFVYYVPENHYPPQTNIAVAHFGGCDVPYKAYLAMKTVDNEVVPWLASQTDMLADDWCVVE